MPVRSLARRDMVCSNSLEARGEEMSEPDWVARGICQIEATSWLTFMAGAATLGVLLTTTSSSLAKALKLG